MCLDSIVKPVSSLRSLTASNPSVGAARVELKLITNSENMFQQVRLWFSIVHKWFFPQQIYQYLRCACLITVLINTQCYHRLVCRQHFLLNIFVLGQRTSLIVITVMWYELTMGFAKWRACPPDHWAGSDVLVSPHPPVANISNLSEGVVSTLVYHNSLQ